MPLDFKLLPFFAIFLAALADPAGAAHVSLKGKLLEKGTRKPLAGYSVFVLPHKLKALTDVDGAFEVTGEIPGEFEGPFSWVVNATGYQRLDLGDVADDAGERTLFLERASYQLYETTIVSKQEKRHDSSKSLSQAEFLQAPGAGGDPVKAVSNLPGINRTLSFSSQVLIQGSGPQDTKYSLDGHEIPLVFHFGGLTSVVIPEAIERVDTLFAGYGPEEGRATGGWIGLWTRSPQTDRVHGLVFADLFTAGALVAGPLGQGATGKPGGFLVSIRQSYIGQVLRAAFKTNSDFNLTVAPEYRDATALYEIELTERDKLKTTFHISEDSLGFLLAEPVKSDPSIRGGFTSSTAFFRLIPQLTHRHGENTVSRWSVGLGKDWISFVNAENYFSLQSVAVTGRAEIDHAFSKEWRSVLGLDTNNRWSRVQLSLPNFYTQGGVGNPLSSGSRRQADITNKQSLVGIYLRNEITPDGSAWTFLPNLRGDYFSPTHEYFISPRPGARFRFNESLTFRTSGGLYAQPPQAQEIDSVFGNPDVKSSRAWHLSVGAEKDFRGGRSEGWTVSSDAFLKELRMIVVPSTHLVTRDGVITPEGYNNDGEGRVVGIQTQAKYSLPDDWSLSVAYTLSRSRRSSSSEPDRPSQYDQTHLLGVLASKELGGNWRLSGRFRYATGNPNTPLTGGVLDSDNDVYLPVRGSIYSERLDSFYQLDVRLDKKWIYDKWILSLYLDIQNLTNRKNIERIEYSYDYTSHTETSGLPVLPTLGLKGEF